MNKTLNKLIFLIITILFLILGSAIKAHCFDYSTNDYRLWRLYALNTEISLQKEQQAHQHTLSDLRMVISYNQIYLESIDYLNIQSTLYYNRYIETLTRLNQLLEHPFEPWDITFNLYGGIGNCVYSGVQANLYVWDNLSVSANACVTILNNYTVYMPQIYGGVGINYIWIWR
jgi:hypothetical protein